MDVYQEINIKDYCDLCFEEITGRIVKNHSEELKNLHFDCYLRLKRKLNNFRRGMKGKEKWAE